jgi:hypothetical protein
MRIPDRFHIALLLSATTATSGCGSTENAYRETHRSARTVLPVAVEMERLFGTADHFITHYGFANQKENTWNTVVFFGQRYVLTMQVKIKVDYDNRKIAVVGDPFWILSEYVSIVGNSARFGKSFTLSSEDWKTLYENNGDFASIGIELNREPVANFGELVAVIRKPRVAISLLEE